MNCPQKIISGGQTGADRGALDFAIAHGIEHGGSCPRSRKAGDGLPLGALELKQRLRRTPCRRLTRFSPIPLQAPGFATHFHTP